MQTIVSGTSLERIVRTVLLMVLIDGFAVAYLWDGYFGYAKENERELSRLLGLSSDTSLCCANPILTANEGRRIAQAAKVGDELSTVTFVLGGPNFHLYRDVYFLGPGGWLKVEIELLEGRIENVAWTDGPKTESDQQWQRRIGYALAVGGLIAAVRLALALTTRLTLTDDGLWIGPQRLIPFDAITALPPDPAGRLGCVELQYTRLGRLTRVRLDRYVYKRLPEIVTQICQRKGFPNPWPASTASTGRA